MLEVVEVEGKWIISFLLKYSYLNQLFAVSATTSSLSRNLEMYLY